MLRQEVYTGAQPFVYALCCREDRQQVEGLLEILQKNDCRLWWDRGVLEEVPPPAVEARPVEEAQLVLAFLSARAVEDHGFRKTFNRSILKGRPMAAVLLEPVELSPLMVAQLALEQVQTVDYALCRTDGACCLTLLQLPQIKHCLEEGKTIHIPKSSTKKYYLKRKSTGEEIQITKDGFTVGRKLTCDYAVEDNESISRVHAVFHLSNGVCTVVDNHSTNKVYVNDRELEEEERFQLKSGDVLELGTEGFIVDVIE